MSGLRRLLLNHHGKVKAAIKTKAVPIFCDPAPHGYGFIRGPPESLSEWQVWANRKNAEQFSNPATMPGIHLVENVCLFLLFVLLFLTFFSLGPDHQGIWRSAF
jgi:hypothetical protein